MPGNQARIARDSRTGRFVSKREASRGPARAGSTTPASPDALRVLLKGDYEAVETAAEAAGMEVVAWIRHTLLTAARAQAPIEPKTPEDIRRAIEKASRYSFPTGDIEDMLRETEVGRWLR